MTRLTGSAKIKFQTVDISEVVPAVSTSIGAIVIDSPRGNIDTPVLVTNKAQFIEEYGKPTADGSDYGHYAALGFLNRGRQLYVVRVHNASLYGGIEIVDSGASGEAVPFSSGEAAPISHTFSADGLFVVYAANPGVWNSKIKVIISDVDVTFYTFKIKVYITDDDGTDNLEETWEVSRKQQLDGFGNQQYLETKINGISKYIKVYDNDSQANTELPKAVSTATALAGGTDGSAVTSTQVVNGWDTHFGNKDLISVNILINGGQTSDEVHAKMIDIAEARGDCFAILDIPLATIQTGVSAVTTWRTSTLNENTSFAAAYSPWIKYLDQYNGQIVTIPPSGHIAAIYAYTDSIYGSAHGAPAGYTRGQLEASALSQDAYSEGSKDTLQDAQINPIVEDPGFGITVFGEDTLLTTKSALSNIHVRRLMNQIQVATTAFARPFLFEPLLERTFFRVRTALEQYMAELEGLGAFDNNDDRGWRVVCDTTNNTASDRDANQLNVWLFIKPVKVAKYIIIKGIITRSSSNFDAILSSGII